MAIKRLYHKLTSEEADSSGFDSETYNERQREVDVKAQRLQLLVYTALFAFIVLAAYGYYLIFNLTHDVHSLSNDVTAMTRSVNKMTLSVEENMSIIAKNMELMQDSTGLLAGTISETMPIMSNNIDNMNANTTTMTKTAVNVSHRIDAMSANIQSMSSGIVGMQRDVWSINETMSNPVEGMMEGMMPWGSNRGSPGPMAFPRPMR